MDFFTSDLHLGHQSIIKRCSRPFRDTAEMDSVLVQNWNAVVVPKDTVYVLGDLFFGTVRTPEEYISIIQGLNGKKHLIKGNHDESWMKYVDLSSLSLCFNEIVDKTTKIRDNNKRGITLGHHPIKEWSNSFEYMIHGHIHNNMDHEALPSTLSNQKLLNAGVDINDYKPATFDELVKNNDRFKRHAAVFILGKNR